MSLREIGCCQSIKCEVGRGRKYDGVGMHGLGHRVFFVPTDAINRQKSS